MDIGMIGLGRMGLNMSLRLLRSGHRVVGYAMHASSVERLTTQGGEGTTSLEELIHLLRAPRVVWLMVPAGKPVDEVLDKIISHMEAGDIVVDGGNSYYKDSMRRAQRCKDANLHFIDVGTSGGIWGLEKGYCLMIGGAGEAVQRLTPIFQCLAPSPTQGWGHVGPSGAGHFVKMIHNGIEYGMMQAIAEGFALMHHKTEFSLDLHRVAEIWRHGSVVRSWLLDLLSDGLASYQDLDKIAPWVEDSGEGRWTVKEAVDLGQAAPVITMALMQRFKSRDEYGFTERILAMLRLQFGGHPIHTGEST